MPRPSPRMHLSLAIGAAFIIGQSAAGAESRRANVLGQSFYAMCAAEFNRGELHQALAHCDKATTADPGLADAYFIRGSILYLRAMVRSDRRAMPPEAIAALRKYLELAPNGAHAAEARHMIETTE